MKSTGAKRRIFCPVRLPQRAVQRPPQFGGFLAILTAQNFAQLGFLEIGRQNPLSVFTQVDRAAGVRIQQRSLGIARNERAYTRAARSN